MYALQAEKSDEITRFIIGCKDQAEIVRQALVARGYDVEGPEEMALTELHRTEAEKQRASALLASIFAH